MSGHCAHICRASQSKGDLNREFKSEHPPPEVRFMQPLVSGRYELSLDLHDDVDSAGYYLHQTLNSDEEAKASALISIV